MAEVDYEEIDRLEEERRVRMAALLDRIPEEWGKDIRFGPGWDDLVLELDAAIAAVKPQYVIYQMKEKFGGLRFYTDHDGETGIRRLIEEAERKSITICETCGAPGTPRGNYWKYTACDEHAEE